MRKASTPDGRSLQIEDQSLLRAMIALGGVFAVGVALYYAFSWTPAQGIPQDPNGLVVGRDFLNFWMFGRAATTPQPGLWYDLAAYQKALADLLGPDRVSGPNWSYPPNVMLLAAPFGRLPYLAALAIWTLIGVVALERTLRARPLRLRLAVLLCPAVLFCVVSGQSSLVTTAAMLLIFALLDSRPILAGVLIGCLTLKPQLGVLFPVMLIASGRWRVFFAAAATTLAIAAATAVAFGPQVWVDFVVKGLPVQNLVLSDPELIATPFFPTVFMNVRGLGASYATAMATQAPFMLAAGVAVFWAFGRRRDADSRLLAALFFAATVSASPYLLSYDTLAFAAGMLILLDAGLLDARGRLIARLAFWLCPLQLVFGTLHAPGPALIAPAALIYLALSLRAHRLAAIIPAPPATSPNTPAAS